jgi:hypothetical protein
MDRRCKPACDGMACPGSDARIAADRTGSAGALQRRARRSAGRKLWTWFEASWFEVSWFEVSCGSPDCANRRAHERADMGARCRGGMRPGFAKFLLVAPPARGAERRKALVRNAAPVAALRLGQSLHRKGLPVHDADRRALRRSTTVFARPWPHSLSGRAFLPGLLTCSPGSPAGSLRTGHLVPVGRGPRRPGSPVVSRTRRQTVPASPSGNHPDGAPQQAG